MDHSREQSRFIAMRKAAGTSAAWDGQERRASYRVAAGLFGKNPRAALNTKAIFREMIVHEIKNGRLSPWRRKRIVRYAAKMGLSAVEAGKLLSDCRQQAMIELEASEETPTLRVHIPDTDDNSTANRVVIAVALALLVNTAIILLLP